MRRLVAISVAVVAVAAAVIAGGVLPRGQAAGPGPLLSRNVPASGTHLAHPASDANDAAYSTMAWCTPPCYVALDLSSTTPGPSIVAWYNVATGFQHQLLGGPAYNLPSSYTIEANAASGGAVPSSGWVTLVEVVDSHYNGRQHLVDLTGYRWIRMNVTKSVGGDAAFNLDVLDARAVGNDTWLIAGDSITSDGLTQDETYQGTQSPSPNFMTRVNAAIPSRFPSQIDAGIGGISATVIAGLYQPNGTKGGGHDHMRDFLASFPSRYVTLNYGTNDVGVPTADFYNAMRILVEDVLAAGRTPIVPTIPWRCNADVTPYNAQIAALYTAYPQVVRGPDLYAYLESNKSLMSNDCIHPKYPSGMSALRQHWADWAIANVYAGLPTSPSVTAAPAVPTATAAPAAPTAPAGAQPVEIENLKCTVTYLDGTTHTGRCSGTFAPD